MAQAKLDKSIAGFAFAPSGKRGLESHSIGSGLLVGEDIKAGDACYIKESDGLVYRSGGSGVTLITQEGARVAGFALETADFNSGGGRQGAVTLVRNFDVAYGGAVLTIVPGRYYYLWVGDASKGMIGADASALNTPPIAGLPPIAIAIDAYRIRVLGW